jgi:hypothetical protein
VNVSDTFVATGAVISHEHAMEYPYVATRGLVAMVEEDAMSTLPLHSGNGETNVTVANTPLSVVANESLVNWATITRGPEAGAT